MKNVTVEFSTTTNINSLIKDELAYVNGIEGTITHVTNELPPVDPPVAPGDYPCSSFSPNKGSLISGNHEVLHVKDGNWLAVQSQFELLKLYNYLDAVVEWKLPGSKANSFILTMNCKYSGLRGQNLYIYNHLTDKYDTIANAYKSIGLAGLEFSVTVNPANHINKDGIVKCKIYTYSRSAFTAYFDYFKLSVQ
jgi:hypothetical protein